MIKNYSPFLIIFLIVFQPIMVESQSVELNFKQISGKNGVTLGKINFITKDKNGLMWFSDQNNSCIIRYDGNQMIQYKKDPKNLNSLGGDYPECLFADSEGNIWIGFYGQGLDKFNPVTGDFEHYKHDPKNQESLGNDFVSSVIIDHLGIVWVGTNGGLDRLDPKTGKFTHYKNNLNDPTSLSHDVVRMIYEDRGGNIWVGTGLAWDNNEHGGLNLFDREKETFKRYMHDPEDSNSLINNKVRAILEDSKGNLWVGTMKDGLHILNRKTDKFTRYPFDPNHPSRISRPALKGAYDHISFLIEDSDEKIWIGTIGNGINRYDPLTKKITHYGNGSDNNKEFKDNSGWMAYPSDDGYVWLTTEENNLYKVDLYNNDLPFKKMDDGMRSFYEESETINWIGTEKGLIRKDLANQTSIIFKSDPLNDYSLSNNYVRKLFKDSQGELWVGTISGLNRYNRENKNFTRYMNDPEDDNSISEDNISVIYEDSKFDLWFGTYSEGLNLFNRKTGKFIRYKHNPRDDNSISNGSIRAILNDKSNNLWIGVGFNGGVNRMNHNTGDFYHYLIGHDITSLYEDSNHSVWAGTLNGLYKYDSSKNDFFPVRDESKDINISSTVVSLLEDSNNNLWVSTASGIYKFDDKRDNLIYYGKERGVLFEDKDLLMSGFVYKTLDGKLMFNKADGYYCFYPEEIKTKIRQPEIYFTSFWVNNELINRNSNELLFESFYQLKKVKLNYSQNIFAFAFSTIDYFELDESILYYKLENYDQSWRKTFVNDRINYYKIPSGNYLFRVKGFNRVDGECYEKLIKITILKPWWDTWWAYTIYTIVVVALLWLLSRFQKAKVVKNERRKAHKKMLIQAKKIKKAYTELKAAQSQLIQSEKMASLGELTAGIAHEIQNPMNFVNNFSEVTIELVDEMIDEIDNNDLKEVKAIADQVKQNLDKINHHGKRADAIVKGMLQHSRSSDGKKEPTEINTLADEYLRLAYQGMRAKDKSFNATLKTDFDNSIGKVNIAAQDIGRVILNLITNAFYVVDEKKKSGLENYEPTVTVSTKKEGDKLEIKVADNGNGIPKDVLDKIFQPFFTTKPTGQGTGLGLSLSYDIVKAHGGELKVETRENEGTEFKVILPV